MIPTSLIKLPTMMTTIKAIMAGKLTTVATQTRALTVAHGKMRLPMVVMAMVLMQLLTAELIKALPVQNIKLTVQMIGSTEVIAIKLKHLVGQTLLLMVTKVIPSMLVRTVLLMLVLGLMGLKTNLALELDIKAPKVGEMAILDLILALKVMVAGMLVPMVAPKLVVTLMVIPNMVLMEVVIGPEKVTATLAPILLDIVLVNGALVMLEKLVLLLARMAGLMVTQMVAEPKTLMLTATVLQMPAIMVVEATKPQQAVIKPVVLVVIVAGTPTHMGVPLMELAVRVLKAVKHTLKVELATAVTASVATTHLELLATLEVLLATEATTLVVMAANTEAAATLALTTVKAAMLVITVKPLMAAVTVKAVMVVIKVVIELCEIIKTTAKGRYYPSYDNLFQNVQ